MDIEKKKIMDEADALGVHVSKFWTMERIQLVVNQAKEKQVKEQPTQKAEETQKDKEENSLEKTENQECPAQACQELQDMWGKVVTCYNANSNYCKACEKDFPDTKAICEAKTLETATQVKVKKVAAKKTGSGHPSGRIKIGFGHVEGTQAAAIDLALQQGMTKENMIKHLNDINLNANGLDDANMWTRITRHFADLKECHSIEIIKDVNNVYTGKVFVPKKEEEDGDNKVEE